MLNLRWMLKEDGFRIRRVLPTWKHRLRALWKKPDADLWPARVKNDGRQRKSREDSAPDNGGMDA